MTYALCDVWGSGIIKKAILCTKVEENSNIKNCICCINYYLLEGLHITP